MIGQSGDTIAAISTGMTNSGIGIVRLSGDAAIDIADKIYRSPSGTKRLKNVASHTVHYGHIYDHDRLVDEVMVLVLKKPNTYTREDIVEIDCHGGTVVMKKILETVIQNGARAAEPGEFTKRAFLNGRIDLSQAEAVIDVIHAKNQMALKSSMSQLKGSIRNTIQAIREEMLHDIAYIEAAIDDPEHIEMESNKENFALHVEKAIKSLEKLRDSADNGRLLREGIQTVILGKPNAGKSSLMNLLLGENRAIVTEIEGTTRDTLEESLNFQGMMLNIIDTAGIRQTQDKIEKIGIDKAIEAAKEADLIIYVVDSSTRLDENDKKIMAMISDKKVIVIMNKSDLSAVTTQKDIQTLIDAPVVEMSAKFEKGLDEFEKALKEMFFSKEISYNDEVMITNVRHKAAIESALESLNMVIMSLRDGMPEDFYTIDMMAAYEQLGYIIGEAVEDDLVNKIFSDFCMGK